MNNETAPLSDELAAFDAAVSAELPRVSHVEYDSHEICKHFAAKVRERMAQGDYLTRRAKELEADAARYRWLRKGEQRPIHGPTASHRDGCEPFTSMVLPGINPAQVTVCGDELDRAIDAALQLDGKEKQRGE